MATKARKNRPVATVTHCIYNENVNLVHKIHMSFRKQTQQIVFEILPRTDIVAIWEQNKYFTNYILFISST